MSFKCMVLYQKAVLKILYLKDAMQQSSMTKLTVPFKNKSLRARLIFAPVGIYLHYAHSFNEKIILSIVLLC